MHKSIWITTRFEGFHRWKDAPEEVAFLRDWHRHIFHVKLWMKVEDLNREIEFISFKRDVERYIKQTFFDVQGKPIPFEWSCEQIAKQLINLFGADSCEVSEDGENGAFLNQGDEQ